MSGLASLSANYTDSEGEDETHNTSGSAEKSVAILLHHPPKTSLTTNAKNVRNVARLVSYNDDIVLSDDEGGGNQNLSDDKDHEVSLEGTDGSIEQNESKQATDSKEDANQSDDDDIELPPEPNGRCSAELQDKILKLHKKMESSSSWDMNQIIQDKKDFRNPSIYEKLIQFCSINELGTNYPPSIYDPERWGKESFYDELSKVQKTEMEKREKERKERTKVEFVSGTAKRPNAASDDSKNRKSKWDQVGGLGLVSGVSIPGLTRPVGVSIVQATITSGVATKGAVISAFGSLPKRPKL